jgi:hypothetical protein
MSLALTLTWALGLGLALLKLLLAAQERRVPKLLALAFKPSLKNSLLLAARMSSPGSLADVFIEQKTDIQEALVKVTTSMRKQAKRRMTFSVCLIVKLDLLTLLSI